VSLGVSPATVAAAYRLLRARGLVTGQGRQGTRVASRLATRVRSGAFTSSAGLRDLSSGNPDEAFLPSMRAALESVHPESRMYGPSPDHAGLLAFAIGEFEADGIPAGALAVLSGGLDAIERILREHLRPGDRVAVEDPGYPGLFDLISASGYTATPFALDDEGPLPDALDAALRRGCQAAIVTPRAHNPTGAAVTPLRAEQLRDVLRRFPHVALVENDHAGPCAGVPYHTVAGASEHWAVVRSLSKFLGPDLRVAVAAGDDVTIARVRGRQSLGARWVSHVLQQLAVTLWADAATGRRAARAGDTYGYRRLAALAAFSANGIAIHGRSGFNLWVPVANESVVVRSLAERGWAVAAGERFRIRSRRGIRITTATLLPEEAPRLAADLADALSPSSTGFA